MDYKNIVLMAKEYERIDGRDAYGPQTKLLTLEQTRKTEQQAAAILAKLWSGESAGDLQEAVKMPVHQVMDMAIFTCRMLLYFQEAYRFPGLYDPDKPQVDRIGLQGGVMPVSVCVDNPSLDKDIQEFYQQLGKDGEMIGERMRTLSRLMKEMGY